MVKGRNKMRRNTIKNKGGCSCTSKLFGGSNVNDCGENVVALKGGSIYPPKNKKNLPRRYKTRKNKKIKKTKGGRVIDDPSFHIFTSGSILPTI